MRAVRRCLFTGALLFLPASLSFAAVDESVQYFEEEAQVTTASRRLQPAREAPVAVDVITQEEIRASGATTIWDLMRFRVGMDVMDGRAADGNRGIVSVRGFPQEYVNNLQVLVDGRSVYSGYSGGVYWPQLPVQLQDIDRIEIVRGPNGALYGSNAGLGVINIITKKPEEPAAASVYGFGGDWGTLQTGAAAEVARERFGGRLSYSYWGEGGNPNAPNVFSSAKDYLTADKLNFRGMLRPFSTTNIELFAGGSWNAQGLSFSRDGDFRQFFGMAKLEQELGANSSLEIMIARDSFNFDILPDFNGHQQIQYTQDDIEALHRFGWWDSRLKTTWGGSYRVSVAQSDQIFSSAPIQGITANPVERNPLRRLFLHQSAEVLDRLTLIGAVSLERSTTGGTQPAYQAAAVITPARDHAFRVSYSFAPTIPDLFEFFANRQSAGPPTSPVSIILHGNNELQPQKLQSYEVGYQGSYFARRLEVDSDVFYMNLRDLSTGAQNFAVTSFFPFQAQSTITFDNLNHAVARGAEAQLTYHFAPARSIFANYTYEYITDQLAEVRIAHGTPKNKFNVGGMASLGHGFSGTVDLGYKSRYSITSANFNQSADVPSYVRLDARLAYRVARNAELFIAGKDLVNQKHGEFPDFLESPRTYYGGLILQF